jgi:FSR family fosmidomycin resistance protein-like MFS transporter
VLGQEYLPRRVGLSSGITYGLAIGLGGLAATALGALADATSTATVLHVLPALAAAAGLLAATLPPDGPTSGASPRRRPRPAAPSPGRRAAR